MMTSNTNPTEAYLWLYLPKQQTPVVVGKLNLINDKYLFTYGQSYLNRENAIGLSPFELPLEKGPQVPTGMKCIHSCIRDASPDAWGRRLIELKYPGEISNELTFLLSAGHNRIGAFDFSDSPESCELNTQDALNIDDISAFIDIAEGQVATAGFLNIINNGTSIGGARPKCFVHFNNKQCIAKFSLSTDYYPIIKAEFIGMRLAKKIGINVAEVSFTQKFDRDILLVERFDRLEDGSRRQILSGLSLLNLDEMEARYASYLDLSDIIRQSFESPKLACLELYKRLVFNILIGNTDDHARNHSAFWDATLNLTPAYDLCPQYRLGKEATQAMQISGSYQNFSTLVNVLSVADKFLLTRQQAIECIQHQVETIEASWAAVCEEACLSKVEQERLVGNVILSDFSMNGWPT